jgi:acyl dehydratase
MAQTVFESLDEVRAAVGTTLGTSGWFEVTQERVNQFADATGDRQWLPDAVADQPRPPRGA